MKKNKNVKLTDKDFEQMQKVKNQYNKYVDTGFHFYLSYWARVFLIFVGVVVIGFLSYWAFSYSFTGKQEITLKYEENADIDYKVKQFEDSITNTSNGEVNSYISSLVDDISTDFKYTYKLDKKADIKYSYYIDATMEVNDKSNNSTLYKKNNKLMKQVNKEEQDVDSITINQNINVDYSNYNKIANSIISYDESNTNITGNVLLKMYVDIEVNCDGFDEKITKSQVVEVVIPLLSKQVNVSLAKKVNESDVYLINKAPELKNKGLLYVGISLLIVDTLFFLMGASFIFRANPKKTKYCKLRDGILRDYDRIIVNAKSFPKISKHNIIDCYSFSELLDAQRLLEKPIIYFEIIKNQKSVFIIIGETDVYEYTLKECDIDY